MILKKFVTEMYVDCFQRKNWLLIYKQKLCFPNGLYLMSINAITCGFIIKIIVHTQDILETLHFSETFISNLYNKRI